jgi:hypothetical protein
MPTNQSLRACICKRNHHEQQEDVHTLQQGGKVSVAGHDVGMAKSHDSILHGM